MRIHSIAYASLIGLLLRQFEVFFIHSDSNWVWFWHPIVWIGYAAFSTIMYVFLFGIVRILMKKQSQDTIQGLSLFLTAILLVIASMSGNIDLSFIHGKEVTGTGSWLIIYCYNLLIIGMPLLVLWIVGTGVWLKKSSIAEKFSLLSRRGTLLISIVIIGLIFIESMIVSFFVNPSGSRTQETLPNVILMSVDTLRKDHMSLYDYPHKTTPALERLFKDGIIFDRCIATAPTTAPNYASIYTGTYPFDHGVYTNVFRYNPDDTGLKTMAELLQDKGYYTVSHLTDCFPGTLQNLDVGMKEVYQRGLKVVSKSGYDIYSIVRNVVSAIETTLDRNVKTHKYNPSTVRTIDWLNGSPREPFYTHIYFHWPHDPYGDRKFDLPVTWSENNVALDREPFARSTDKEYIRSIRNKYNSDIYYTDVQFGSIMNVLEHNGFLDNSIIVFTADHGEDLGERLLDDTPYFGHSYWLYESSTNVPLAFRFPEKILNPDRVDFPVSSVDIFPTVLTLLGFNIPSEVHGKPLFRNEDHQILLNKDLAHSRPYVYSFTFLGNDGTFSGVFSSEYTHHYYYLQDEHEEIYNIKSDYHSNHDLSSEAPELIALYKAQMDKWFNENNFSWPKGAKFQEVEKDLDPTIREQLKALGYLQ
jgi:arylsulfatase A-like enzyme